MQRHRKRAHAELEWAPSEITVEVSFTLIWRGYGEGDASQQNRIGLPGVSLVPCISNVGRGDGNQAGESPGRATGRTKMVILEVGAELAGNLEFAVGNRHAVIRMIEGRLRECNGGEVRMYLQVSSRLK